MRSNAYGGGSAPSVPCSAEEQLPIWQYKAIESVGRVIAFWGFKENHGRIWAYLYLKDQATSVADIRRVLGLSKGAASMLLQDLENWNIILRADTESSRKRLYKANDQLMQMISHVFQSRESGLIKKTLDDLNEAERLAVQSDIDLITLQRLRKMKKLAELMNHILRFVSVAAKLDIHQIISLFPLSMGLKK